MATETLTWAAAVEIVCCELEEFAAHRDAGRSVLETALAMCIERGRAEQYERTLSTLLAALKTGAAPEAPGAAPQAHHNTEGVNAP